MTQPIAKKKPAMMPQRQQRAVNTSRRLLNELGESALMALMTSSGRYLPARDSNAHQNAL